MNISPIGLATDDLDTPALVLDMDACEHNIALMSKRIAAGGKAWRPHAKAFKTPAIAHLLLRAGACGLTVAKVSEAEVMAAGGVRDLLIANLVVGRPKCERLAALERFADVKVTVDHPDQVEPLGAAARKFGVTIGVLTDTDIGLARTGVQSASEALDLSRLVAKTPGLRFAGLMGYEGHTLMIPDPVAKRSAIEASLGRLSAVKAHVEAGGLECPIVSAGGSGSYEIAACVAGATELQAGGGIFACRYYTEGCKISGHLPAISVLSTVVSRPVPERVVLDIGFKSISAHKQDPVIARIPGSRLLGLSAEHATFFVPAESGLTIGTKVEVTPGYSDLTFFLHDRVLARRRNTIEAVWELWGRGKLQ